jgi:hypothetical protein
VRFENKNTFFDFEKRSSLLQRAGVVAVKSEVLGLAPDLFESSSEGISEHNYLTRKNCLFTSYVNAST